MSATVPAGNAAAGQNEAARRIMILLNSRAQDFAHDDLILISMREVAEALIEHGLVATPPAMPISDADAVERAGYAMYLADYAVGPRARGGRPFTIEEYRRGAGDARMDYDRRARAALNTLNERRRLIASNLD